MQRVRCEDVVGVCNDMFARVEEADDVTQGISDHRTKVADDRSESAITDNGMAGNKNMGPRRMIRTGNLIVVCQFCDNGSNSSGHGVRRKYSCIWHGVDGGDDIVVTSGSSRWRGVWVSATHGTVDGDDDRGTPLVDSQSQRVHGGEVVACATRTSTEADAVGGGLTAARDKRMVMTAGRERRRIIVWMDERCGATSRTI